MQRTRRGADDVGAPHDLLCCARTLAQFRGFAVRPLDDELLPDEELLPDDEGEGGGAELVLRGRWDAVPLELPCVCV